MLKNVLVAVVLATALVLFSLFAYSRLIPQSSTITVVGVGKTVVKSAKISLIVSRVSSGSDVAAVIDDNEGAITRLVMVARRLGGAGVEIKKSFYQITPQNNQYLVANAISIKSDNVAGINDLIKEMYRGGATSVSTVAFLPTDEEATEQEARILAVKDALDQAKKIAKSIGKNLGKVVSIADNQEGATSTVSNALAENGSQLTISKSVSVVYEIW